MFNLQGPIQSYAFDPVDRHTIYANGIGLFRSRDDGQTWHLIYPKPSSIRHIETASDHAEERLVADPDQIGTITSFGIDTEALYVSAKRGSSFVLMASRDGGESWSEMARLEEPWLSTRAEGGQVVGISAHQITIMGRQGPVKRTTKFVIESAAVGSFNSSTAVYAVSQDHLFVSTDEGATFTEATLPGSGTEVRAVATSFHHGDVAYVSFSEMEVDGKKYLGVAKTTNAGRSWSSIWRDTSSQLAENVQDAWIAPALGAGWPENPLMLTVADDDPNLVYATDLGRTMKSVDGGGHWTGVYSRRNGSGWTSTGLDVTTAYGIHFDPFDPKHVFISYTDIGLLQSDDGAGSWNRTMRGVPERWSNTAYWVVFDPDVRGKMWMANSGTHDLPRPKMWRQKSPQNFVGGVSCSEDGGHNWIPCNTGIPQTAVTHLVLDPRSPRDHRTLYATAFGRGVYKSTDSGAHWVLKNEGIKELEPFAWRLTLANDGTLYLVVARRSENGASGPEGNGAIYRSTDGAEHWTAVALPAGVNGPNGLTIDVRDSSRIYLAAWPRAVGLHGEGGGIYLSTNGGAAWNRVLDRDQHVYDVTIDPRNPAHLYAAGFESCAWQSRDRGEHWTRISGFNFKWGHRVIPDPADPDSIFVTTFGGSVWHGRVDGPNTPVDVLTPELQPGTPR
jgi:photosystem II stability/assembly factor-like uncharacterized protein